VGEGEGGAAAGARPCRIEDLPKVQLEPVMATLLQAGGSSVGWQCWQANMRVHEIAGASGNRRDLVNYYCSVLGWAHAVPEPHRPDHSPDGLRGFARIR
jgi:hypothetical protein